MITVTQAAALLGISSRRIRVLIAQGRIPGAKLERHPMQPRAFWMVPDAPVISPPKRAVRDDTR